MPQFRVLHGEHIQTDADGRERKYGPRSEHGNVVTVPDGKDLAKQFGREKYERIYDDSSRSAHSPPADPSVTIQPGESIKDFAARIAKLADNPTTAPPVASAPAPSQPAKPPRNLDTEYGPLDKKSVKELEEIAEAEEIDLKGAVKKEDMLKTIRADMVDRAAKKGASS